MGNVIVSDDWEDERDRAWEYERCAKCGARLHLDGWCIDCDEEDER